MATPSVINIGLAGFVTAPAAHGASVLHVDWRPPAGGARDLGLLLAHMEDDADDPIGVRVATGNATAMQRLLSARPMLVDVLPARQVIPSLSGAKNCLLHAGPPIAWERMCGPMRGAAVGAILFEGWAADPERAGALAESGGVQFQACHEAGAVGPMAGVVSPSMPVLVVDDVEHRTRAFATMNEGLGKVLRFGAYDASVMHRLRWMADTLGPALSHALSTNGPVDLKMLTGQALQMGDECHNRNVAATSLFARLIAPALVRSADADTAAVVLDVLQANNHFYVNVSMAGCKASLDAPHRVPDSTLETAMARNGVEFGIHVSGTGSTWFTAPSTVPDGLYFAGFGPADANPDLGDSAITETAGIGGFAMAAAPAIVRFVDGEAADAVRYTEEMGRITLGRNPDYALPSLSFAGTPTGIDLRRVVDSGTAPVINTGIAHRLPGVGQIGAGIARAPLEGFTAGLQGVGRNLGLEA